MPNFALIDFETTGLSPLQGDRATEVAIVRVRDGQIVERFSSLMNPGRFIPRFVEELTGITNAMVANAPSGAQVMAQARDFVGTDPLVAHNAAFDRRFWQAQGGDASASTPTRFACTMLIARRLYRDLRNHQLGTLVKQHRLPAARAHRALADAEMTFHLWQHMQADMHARYGVADLTFALMEKVQKAKADKIAEIVAAYLKPAQTRTLAEPLDAANGSLMVCVPNVHVATPV